MYDALVEFLGTPATEAQENFLYFASFFLLVYFIGIIIDVAVSLTKL